MQQTLIKKSCSFVEQSSSLTYLFLGSNCLYICPEDYSCYDTSFKIHQGWLRNVTACLKTTRTETVIREINGPETTTYDVTTAAAKVEDDDWWFTSLVKNVFGKIIQLVI